MRRPRSDRTEGAFRAPLALPGLFAVLGLLPLLAGCPGPAPAPGPDPALSPAARPIGEAEAALLSPPGSVVRFRVESRGVFEADLSGTLWIASGNRARLEARGSFGGRSGDLLLVSDGTRLQVHDFVGPAAEWRTPPRLNEALVVGLLRMGILHNLARLTAAEAPDHAGPGARGWVRPVEASLVRGEAGRTVIEHGVEVAGARAAEATVVLEGAPPLPVERRQVVSFPSGGMEVVERYPLVRTGVTPDPSLFHLPDFPVEVPGTRGAEGAGGGPPATRDAPPAGGGRG